MSIEPNSPATPVSYTGRYYAMPLRGRLTPYEGGKFATAPATSHDGAKPPAAAQNTDQSANQKNGFSIAGFVDLINPLQHIPLVSTLYRRITGDEVTPVGRVAGGALFFGPIGFVSGLFNTALEKVTGKDAGDHVMTAMLGDKDKAPAADPENDPNASLAAAPQTEILRGTVKVIPKTDAAPTSLDAATLDALSRTIGTTAPLAHLAPPQSAANSTAKPALSPGQLAAATSYNDALIRMQQGLDQYQAQKP